MNEFKKKTKSILLYAMRGMKLTDEDRNLINDKIDQIESILLSYPIKILRNYIKKDKVYALLDISDDFIYTIIKSKIIKMRRVVDSKTKVEENIDTYDKIAEDLNMNFPELEIELLGGNYMKKQIMKDIYDDYKNKIDNIIQYFSSSKTDYFEGQNYVKERIKGYDIFVNFDDFKQYLLKMHYSTKYRFGVYNNIALEGFKNVINEFMRYIYHKTNPEVEYNKDQNTAPIIKERENKEEEQMELVYTKDKVQQIANTYKHYLDFMYKKFKIKMILEIGIPCTINYDGMSEDEINKILDDYMESFYKNFDDDFSRAKFDKVIEIYEKYYKLYSEEKEKRGSAISRGKTKANAAKRKEKEEITEEKKEYNLIKTENVEEKDESEITVKSSEDNNLSIIKPIFTDQGPSNNKIKKENRTVSNENNNWKEVYEAYHEDTILDYISKLMNIIKKKPTEERKEFLSKLLDFALEN